MHLRFATVERYNCTYSAEPMSYINLYLHISYMIMFFLFLFFLGFFCAGSCLKFGVPKLSVGEINNYNKNRKNGNNGREGFLLTCMEHVLNLWRCKDECICMWRTAGWAPEWVVHRGGCVGTPQPWAWQSQGDWAPISIDHCQMSNPDSTLYF